MSESVRRRVGLVLAFASVVASTACVHVSQRVWYNGQAMTSSRQYRDVMAGDHSFRTMRGMYFNSNALRLSQPAPARYTPFTNW